MTGDRLGIIISLKVRDRECVISISRSMSTASRRRDSNLNLFTNLHISRCLFDKHRQNTDQISETSKYRRNNKFNRRYVCVRLLYVWTIDNCIYYFYPMIFLHINQSEIFCQKAVYFVKVSCKSNNILRYLPLWTIQFSRFNIACIL